MDRTTTESAVEVRERLIASLENSALTDAEITRIERKIKLLDKAGE